MTIYFEGEGKALRRKHTPQLAGGARIGLRGQILVDTKNREYTVSTLLLIYYPNYAHRPCLYMFGTVRDSDT